MSQARFTITTCGIEAGLKLQESGLAIKLSEFRLGAGYGYQPQKSDTELHGMALYTGKPTKYRYIDDHTKLIVCEIPPAAGPFSYGEIALYTDDVKGNKVLFALCAFDTPIQKFSSLESSVASSATFNCILTVDQGNTNIRLSYTDNPQALALEFECLDKFDSIKSPKTLQYSDSIQALIINELSPDGNQTLLTRGYKTDDWSVASTWSMWANNPTLSTVNQIYIEVPANTVYKSFRNTGKNHYLIQIDKNTFRLATLTVNSNSLRFTWYTVATVSKSSKINIFYLTSDLLSQVTSKFNNVDTTVKNLSSSYVTLNTDQTITGAKTFTQVIEGTAQYALWADLAEMYETDDSYPCGTLMQYGGTKEFTIASSEVNAVVSSRPGLLLNHGNGNQALAMIGRVPVRVIGKVNKHDRLVLSDYAGVAKANNLALDWDVIGRALESKLDDGEGLIECTVRFKP